MHIKSQNWLCKRYLWWICEFMLTNMTRTWNYPNSFFPAGGSRVFHPRAVLSDVHVCRGVGDSGPEHPPAALSPLEVQTVPHSHLLIFEISKWVMVTIPPHFFSLRFFHRPADGSEVMYDPVSVMNADILNYCQKESWCKLGFYLLSFFYYLYR